MTKFVVKTIENLEDVAINEIRELLNEKASKLCKGRVVFDADKIDKIVKNAKSIYAVYELIREFEFLSIEDIIENIKDVDFSFICSDFVVRCSRGGNHNFNSNEVERRVGEIIASRGYKVNLRSNRIVYVDLIKNICMIGILISDNLGKRSYRVKIINQSIKPIIAYSLLRISDYKKKESLLDPFCKDGVILVEAGLLGGKKLYGFDNENNIRNARINAAMAKIKINFYAQDESYDFKEKNIDRIITSIPFITKRSNENRIKKILENFFGRTCRHAKKIVGIITRNDSHVKELAEKYGLKLIENKSFKIGEENNSIMVFKPQKGN